MSKMKNTLVRVPLLGAILQKSARILRAPAKIDMLNGETANQKGLIDMLQKENQRLVHAVSKIDKRIRTEQEQTDNRYDSLLTKIHSLEKYSASRAPTSLAPESQLFADNHALDEFYTHFEDKFRGNEEMIKKRLTVYIDRFLAAKLDYKKYPVIDIGCGRGEMLSLLSENKINAIGIDLNEDMVKRAKQKKLKAVQANALDYLKSQKTSSVSAVTGFHIIEHIPFEYILELFSECLRVLKKGGFIIFETPNPENIDVSTINFYLDPSHLRPIPPSLVEFVAKNLGYKDVEILRLHPQYTENIEENASEIEKHIKGRFAAAQDYSVIAYK